MSQNNAPADTTTDKPQPADDPRGVSPEDYRLFWACFIALITTAFGFIIRAMIMNDWGEQFKLSETQKGEIFGVGLWPFAISIVLFSLLIDRIGYGVAMVFAFVCHLTSAAVTIATPAVAGDSPTTAYWMLYAGNFIVALGNGTVEAVINPVVATIFSRDKTKWLNMLHAGWPGGLVLGGVLVLLVGSQTGWQAKVALILLPTLAYGVMMLSCRFPVNERVAAGVPFRDMLAEFGGLGAAVAMFLIVSELGRVFAVAVPVQLAIIGLSVVGFTVYVASPGKPIFFLLMLIMIPLATTELGTDSWVTPLMEGEMAKLGLPAVSVLIYTSAIMMVLRFCAGPIVHALSPLGLLAGSAALAAAGLYALSLSGGFVILLAATLYAFGKTFFWPTMLGVTAEQFPRGGALTLNAMGGVGMLAVGVLGAPFLGINQDWKIDSELQARNPQLHHRVIADEKSGLFGLTYRPLDDARIRALPQAESDTIDEVRTIAAKNVLAITALFPLGMLVAYLALLVYYQLTGGYRAVQLDDNSTKGQAKLDTP